MLFCSARGFLLPEQERRTPELQVRGCTCTTLRYLDYHRQECLSAGKQNGRVSESCQSQLFRYVGEEEEGEEKKVVLQKGKQTSRLSLVFQTEVQPSPTGEITA